MYEPKMFYKNLANKSKIIRVWAVKIIQRKLQIRDSEIRDKVPYLTQNRKMANKGLPESPLFASKLLENKPKNGSESLRPPLKANK